MARLEVVLILLLADVATTEDALWAVVVFVVAVVAVKINKYFSVKLNSTMCNVNKLDFSRPAKAHAQQLTTYVYL